jgi:serine/threonine protein phosphatase PrpC
MKLEALRILLHGGGLYKNLPNGEIEMFTSSDNLPESTKIYPGGIPISRSVGDVENKVRDLGGSPFVMSNEPHIFALELQNNHDFLLISSGGLGESLSNKEMSECVWKVIAH